MVLLVAACGGVTPSVSPSPSEGGEASSAPSASLATSASPSPLSPPPTPTATAASTPSATLPVDAAPVGLQGTWARQGATQSLRLVITASSYRITRDGNTGGGSISVDGDVIHFENSSPCNGMGDYRWSLDDGVLTFEPIEADDCPGRAGALEDVNYVLLFPPT
jgi:hypothetical protein